jgi:hypothetical protein
MSRRGSSDGSSCVREDGWQVSSSTGGVLGGLVGGVKYDLELGDCALQLPPREENLAPADSETEMWRYGRVPFKLLTVTLRSPAGCLHRFTTDSRPARKSLDWLLIFGYSMPHVIPVC